MSDICVCRRTGRCHCLVMRGSSHGWVDGLTIQSATMIYSHVWTFCLALETPAAAWYLVRHTGRLWQPVSTQSPIISTTATMSLTIMTLTHRPVNDTDTQGDCVSQWTHRALSSVLPLPCHLPSWLWHTDQLIEHFIYSSWRCGRHFTYDSVLYVWTWTMISYMYATS